MQKDAEYKKNNPLKLKYAITPETDHSPRPLRQRFSINPHVCVSLHNPKNKANFNLRGSCLTTDTIQIRQKGINRLTVHRLEIEKR